MTTRFFAWSRCLSEISQLECLWSQSQTCACIFIHLLQHYHIIPSHCFSILSFMSQLQALQQAQQECIESAHRGEPASPRAHGTHDRSPAREHGGEQRPAEAPWQPHQTSFSQDLPQGLWASLAVYVERFHVPVFWGIWGQFVCVWSSLNVTSLCGCGHLSPT